MPFEQRTSIFFICKQCGHEFEIPGSATYGGIYKCAKEGCNYEETFLGIQPTSYSVSQQNSEGILKRTLRNPIVQGVIVAAIVIAIVGAISNNLISDFRKELQEIRNEISLIEGDR